MTMAVERNRKRLRFKGIRRVFSAFLVSVLFYVAFSLLISTREERLLMEENRVYARRYSGMASKARMLGSALKDLQARDDGIHRSLFHAAAPSLDPVTAVDIIAADDSLSDSFFLSYSASKAESLRKMADNVEDNFRAVFDALVSRKASLPPLSLPLKDMSYTRTGASVGEKLNPFYKKEVHHSGIDFVARSGEPVFASADGVVTDVDRGTRGMGYMVEINHGNGFVTRYGFLDDMTVSKGQSGRRGSRIGNVGVAGSSYGPHLHYEVLRGGEVQDPVNYLFASVSPEEYANMLYMSANTGQSMD